MCGLVVYCVVNLVYDFVGEIWLVVVGWCCWVVCFGYDVEVL